jgi:phosphoserine phosphatase RsbU/P
VRCAAAEPGGWHFKNGIWLMRYQDSTQVNCGSPVPSDSELALKNRALDVAAEGITITDPRKPDNPLLYVNQGFSRVTGYEAEEVIGRNCRFLQGPDTDPAAAEEIRQAIRDVRPCLVEILNYRKDGTSFWNRLSITPVRDASGLVTHFIGVQSDVTVRRRAEEALREANRELEIAGRRMRRSLEAAAAVQRSLLPARLPEVPGARFAFGFRPCDELAGDALNVVRLDEHLVGFYVIDVAGHGVPSALLSVTLTRLLSPAFEGSCLWTRVPGDPPGKVVTPPARVAAQLNQQFRLQEDDRHYFTMLYGMIDTRRLELRLVAAGHPPPMLLRPGMPASLLECGGLPIGILDAPGFEETHVQLAAGDRLFLYSDGLTEASDGSGNELGIGGLMAAAERLRETPLQEAVSSMMMSVEAWAGPGNIGDDMSLLGIEMVAAAGGAV